MTNIIKFSGRSRFNFEPDGADVGDSLPSSGPPRTAEDHVEAKIPPEIVEDDLFTVSQLSPSKTVRGCRDHSESSDCNDEIRGSFAPAPEAPITISPMRPSRKRASSAEHASDTEPDGACPDKWEKRCLITESNREGEVWGGGKRKVQRSGGQKLLPLSLPSRENGGASSSLTLTRRLKAKAVRESPRVRKLRDKLAGRVLAGGGTGRRPVIGGAKMVSRGGHAMLDVCSFTGNEGASTTTSIAMLPGKGCDRASLDETTRPTMPYSGDNVSLFLCWDASVII